MSDLTAEEQTNVRTAIKFLRTRLRGWAPLAKAMRFKFATMRRVAGGHKAVSATMAIRVARFAEVGVDDLLAGRYPAAGACPHCGHVRGAVA